MSRGLIDTLPEPLKTLRTQPLFVVRLEVRKLQIVGATPGPYRRVGVVPGGSFGGERLSGLWLAKPRARNRDRSSRADGPIYSIFEIL
jgi:hypothetical protein